MSRSKPKQLQRRCAGKRSFDTLDQAKAAAAGLAWRLEKQGNPKVTFLRAYGCHCGRFHFGNSKVIDWAKVTKPFTSLIK